MKKLLFSIIALTATSAVAQTQSQLAASAQNDTQPNTTLEAPLPVGPPVLPSEVWAKEDIGVIGQFVEAPNVLDPINPLAKPELGYGEQNINRDPITGEIKGLNLIAFNF